MTERGRTLVRALVVAASLASGIVAGGPVATARAQAPELQPAPPPSKEKVLELLAPFPGEPDRWLYPGASIVHADPSPATKDEPAKLWLTLETSDQPEAVQRYYGEYIKELDPKTAEVAGLGSRWIARTDDATVVLFPDDGKTTVSINLTATPQH